MTVWIAKSTSFVDGYISMYGVYGELQKAQKACQEIDDGPEPLNWDYSAYNDLWEAETRIGMYTVQEYQVQ
jgi:hypothetical protein